MLTFDDDIEEIDEDEDPERVEEQAEAARAALEALKARRKVFLRFATACEKAGKALAQVAAELDEFYAARGEVFDHEALDLESLMTSDVNFRDLTLADGPGESETLSDIVLALDENAPDAMRKFLVKLQEYLEDIVSRNDEWLDALDEEEDEDDESEDDAPSDEEE